MGGVKTPYHSMDLKVQTTVDSLRNDEEPEKAEANRLRKMKWSIEDEEDSDPTEAQPEAETMDVQDAESESFQGTENMVTDDETEDEMEQYTSVKNIVVAQGNVSISELKKELPNISTKKLEGMSIKYLPYYLSITNDSLL
jgi:hypothetical protein